MYSRKLQKYSFTVIVSQNIAFVLLIKKNSEKYNKKLQITTKRLPRCTVSQSKTWVLLNTAKWSLNRAKWSLSTTETQLSHEIWMIKGLLMSHILKGLPLPWQYRTKYY
jgi:hypothetical protein